jgi:hypothetical protein
MSRSWLREWFACDRDGGVQEVPDAAGEVALEAADGVAVGLAFGLLCGCWTFSGQGLLRALPRFYQVTPNIPDRRRATQQKQVRPDGSTASKRVSSPSGRDLLHSLGHHRHHRSKQQPPSRGAEVGFGLAIAS